MRHFWYGWVLRRKWFLDDCGKRTYVLSVGHEGALVHECFNWEEGYYWNRARSIGTLALRAGWPESKMRDFLGVPSEDALKEAGLTMGEWLAAKEDNRGA